MRFRDELLNNNFNKNIYSELDYCSCSIEDQFYWHFTLFRTKKEYVHLS